MNICLYANETIFTKKNDNSLYVAEQLENRGYPVDIFTKPDAMLAEPYDVVFCRFDHPIQHGFLTQLEQHRDKLFVNPPAAIKRLANKNYLQEFPELVAPLDVISTSEEGISFLEKYSHAVIKPLAEYGGKGIQELSRHNAEDILPKALSMYGPMIIQEFIEEIAQYGDKRITVINGEPTTAILRIPKEDSFLCNLLSGGSYTAAEITESDRVIIEKIKPFLLENGVFWAGVDIIGPYLGEINGTSPGALKECDESSQKSCSIDAIITGMRDWYDNRRT